MAVRATGWIGEVRRLRGGDAPVRRRAAAALERDTPLRALPYLLHALEDPNPAVRLHAAGAVLRLGEQAAAERAARVLGALAKQGSHGVEALDRLARGGFADDVVDEAVARALGDEAPAMRAAALRAVRHRMLATHAGAAVEALGDVDEVAVEAAEALGILYALRGAEGDPEVARAVAALAAALEDPRPPVRAAAIRALGWIEAAGAAADLARVARSGTAAERRAAVRALITVRGGGVVVTEALAAAARDDVHRARALRALGRRGEGAVEPLVELGAELGAAAVAGALARAVGDVEQLIPWLADPSRRDLAVAALGRAGSAARPATDALLRLARQGHGGAVRALGAQGPPALPHLARLLGEPSTARPVLEALPELGEGMEPLVDAVAPHAATPAGRRALIALGGVAVGPLADLLARGDPGARRAVLAALHARPEPELIALPLQALHDPHPGIRAAAARVLGRWRAVARPVASELVPLLGDPIGRVRRAAAWALGECARPRAPEVRPSPPEGAIGALREVCADPAEAVRREARMALAKVGAQGPEAAQPA